MILTAPGPGENQEYVSLIEKAGSTLTDDLLEDDSLVLQEIVGSLSIYRHDRTENHGAPIFVRKGNDDGKPLIVLNEGEDYLPSCNKKKTFVVLKRFGTVKNHYRIFFGYVK